MGFNLLIVSKKKINKMCIYIDLKNVNEAMIKDHYVLPFIEHVLEWVTCQEVFGFLDGFYGYNQVIIDLVDQHKTTFSTREWEILVFRVMPFCLFVQCP